MMRQMTTVLEIDRTSRGGIRRPQSAKMQHAIEIEICWNLSLQFLGHSVRGELMYSTLRIVRITLGCETSLYPHQ
jgi:hypothetical protein